jgi:hypothetical protein
VMQLRRVMLARSTWLKRCYQQELRQFGGVQGSMLLTISIDPNGQTRTRITRTSFSNTLNACVSQQLATMHVEGAQPGIFNVPVTFEP